MPFTLVGSIATLTTEWQYTDPIVGEYFRLKHSEAQHGVSYAVAQVIFLGDGAIQFIDGHILTYEKNAADTLHLKKPAWATDRRLAFKRFPRQETLEEQLRRLLLPGFLQPQPQDVFNLVRQSQWKIDIEVSDYLEPVINYDTRFASIDSSFISVNSKLDEISAKISSSETTTSTSPSTSGTPLNYVSNGDENGVFFYLGSAQKTSSFSNPVVSGIIDSFGSSAFNDTTPTQNIADRNVNNIFLSSNTADSYVGVNLKTKKLIITGYTLQGNEIERQFIRNWKLQGSNDNSNWTDLDVQTNNATITGYNYYYKAISGQTTAYQYFRILQTGINASSQNYLCIPEWELYGTLTTPTTTTDSSFSSVVLLCHFDSTPITDVKNHPITVTGNASISAAQSKFGGVSAYFPLGIGNYLQSPAHIDWELAGTTFTIEAWVYLTSSNTGSANSGGAIVGTIQNVAGAGWGAFINSTQLLFESAGGYQLWKLNTSINLNSWYFISFSKNADDTVMYLGLNGNVSPVQRVINHAGTWDNNAAPLRIAQTQHPQYPLSFDGYLDELRITKGVARYTSNFTVPSTAFPNN